MNPRDIALEVLCALDRSSGTGDQVLESALGGHAWLSARDRAFIAHLVRGVWRYQIRLDWMIRQALKFPFERVEARVRHILRLALYQIFFMDRVPDSAAVNEAVQQARAIGRKPVPAVVNGILRHLCRSREAIRFPDRSRDLHRYLSLFHSYPLWLVKKWVREMGAQEAEGLLAAGNRIPALEIRTNTMKTTRALLLDRMERDGFESQPMAYAPEGISVRGGRGPVEDIPTFQEGLFQVQGQSAQIASHLLRPAAGEKILDLCAGLGGKSTHLAQLMKDQGLIVALDLDPCRLRSLLANGARLGIQSISPLLADGSRALTGLFRSPFDRVLVDAPCSGLGVIDRRPDIKRVKQAADIPRLARMQGLMLDRTLPLVKEGGRILYTVCTLSREENEGVVEGFLERNQGLRLQNLRKTAPAWAHDLLDENGFYRALPHVHGTEGFFGALFVKDKER